MSWVSAVLGFVLGAAVLAGAAVAEDAKPRFKAVAFDYFVIFNPKSVVPEVEKVFPGKGAELAAAWRQKQFEYGFLRAITGQYEDFLKVTEDALRYAVAAMKLEITDAQKDQLVSAYLHLTPWPDAIAGLKRLRAAGVRIITIANFSPRMLRENAERAGMVDLFDELLSTEANRSYKPEARAYALGLERLGLKKDDVVFAAFGGWDAYGAKSFGFHTVWVNRFGLPVEKLGVEPDVVASDMSGLLDTVLGPQR